MERYSALLDVDSHALLCIGNPTSIGLLAETISSSFVMISVNWPNYEKEFFLLSLKPLEYPEWSWSGYKREFLRTDPALITDELRERAVLAAVKNRGIAHMLRYLSLSRAVLDKGVSHQDFVYQEKKREADALKAAGYKADESDFPYVSGYAKATNKSLKEAAEKILNAAKKTASVIAETENFRIKYFDKLKHAATQEEVYSTLAEFNKESFYTGQVFHV